MEDAVSKDIYVSGASFDKIEGAITNALMEADRGDYDKNFSRPPNVTLAKAITISQDQGLSTQEWTKLIIDFGPLAATIGESIWTIVIVPKLRSVFRDRFSEVNPNKREPGA
jgi:hypothetical protein